MKIVTIVKNSPITGVCYGTVEISRYNNNTQRRINRHLEFCNRLRKRQNMRMIKTHRTHSK